jgi:DNA-directed RNA polymerase specialized sigma24 family protein
MTPELPRGRPPRPENLAAELELIDLDAIARNAHSRLWQRARQLVERGDVTGQQIAQALGVSLSTVRRNTQRGQGPA